MFILGIIAACGMGLVLSLLGAGGSILTLPILVYLFNISVIDATSHSLLLVGVTAGFSFFVYLRQKLVDLKVGIIFGIWGCRRLFEKIQDLRSKGAKFYAMTFISLFNSSSLLFMLDDEVDDDMLLFDVKLFNDVELIDLFMPC